MPPTSMPRTGITDILPCMIVLSGADLVLPGGVQSEGTLGHREWRCDIVRRCIGATGARGATQVRTRVDLRGHIVLPGFIDVHVHGLEGIDTLDGRQRIAGDRGRVCRNLA